MITYRYTATLAASSVKILVNVEMSASMDDAIFVKSLGSWPKCLGFYRTRAMIFTYNPREAAKSIISATTLLSWKSNHIPNKVWDELTYIQPQTSTLHCWNLGMGKQFHPTLYNAYNYLSMVGLKLIHFSKRAHSKENLSDEKNIFTVLSIKIFQGIAIHCVQKLSTFNFFIDIWPSILPNTDNVVPPLKHAWSFKTSYRASQPKQPS